MKNKDAAKVYMKEYYENNKSANKISQNDVNLQQFTRTWPSVTAGYGGRRGRWDRGGGRGRRCSAEHWTHMLTVIG